uniref:Uncharacterized protein n=1 Tax=Trypanosoma vivax (strain Y486) TaxID=1055687 RepID=G0TUG6_TRYVY|nr:conserved hypothetical protein [Trypanosoma vivax Y486]
MPIWEQDGTVENSLIPPRSLGVQRRTQLLMERQLSKEDIQAISRVSQIFLSCTGRLPRTHVRQSEVNARLLFGYCRANTVNASSVHRQTQRTATATSTRCMGHSLAPITRYKSIHSCSCIFTNSPTLCCLIIIKRLVQLLA